MSYKAEVIADYSGTWTGNSLRFATHEEADAYAVDLAHRWLSVRQFRVVESDEAANYKWEGGHAVPLPISGEEKLLDAIIASGRKVPE